MNIKNVHDFSKNFGITFFSRTFPSLEITIFLFHDFSRFFMTVQTLLVSGWNSGVSILLYLPKNNQGYIYIYVSKDAWEFWAHTNSIVIFWLDPFQCTSHATRVEYEVYRPNCHNLIKLIVITNCSHPLTVTCVLVDRWICVHSSFRHCITHSCLFSFAFRFFFNGHVYSHRP